MFLFLLEGRGHGTQTVMKVYIPDLLEDLRLVLQIAVQVAPGVHAEVLHHHLIDQLLQLTQLRAQMSEGQTDT